MADPELPDMAAAANALTTFATEMTKLCRIPQTTSPMSLENINATLQQLNSKVRCTSSRG